MFKNNKRNDDGYSMIGLIVGVAIVLILGIGSFSGYMNDSQGAIETQKNVNEQIELVEEVNRQKQESESQLFNELEKN